MVHTKINSKRFLMILLALFMVLATATLSFAAEKVEATQARSGEINLTNAKFVKANGKDYSLNMGTGVIQSAKMQGSKITIFLKSQKVFFYTGKITEAYYNANDGNNLVTDNGSGYYMTLDKSKVVSFANGKKGIKLDAMKFSFKPNKPLKMPDPVKNVYFVCDEFK